MANSHIARRAAHPSASRRMSTPGQAVCRATTVQGPRPAAHWPASAQPAAGVKPVATPSASQSVPRPGTTRRLALFSGPFFRNFGGTRNFARNSGESLKPRQYTTRNSPHTARFNLQACVTPSRKACSPEPALQMGSSLKITRNSRSSSATLRARAKTAQGERHSLVVVWPSHIGCGLP